MERLQKLKRLRALLTNYTRTNKELFYKESAKSLEVEISSTSLSKVLTAGTHTLFEEKNVEKAVKKTANKIRLADREYQREYGLSGSWLLGPFLCWRTESDYKLEDLAVSPLFKIPVNIEKHKSGTWKLALEEKELIVNQSLQLLLKKSWGIELPSSVDNIDKIYQALIDGGKSVAQIKANWIPKIPPRTRAVRNEYGEIINRVKVDIKEELPAEQLELYQSTNDSTFYIIDRFTCSHINASRTALVSDYDSIIEDDLNHQLIDELLAERRVPIELHTVNLDKIPEKENKLVLQVDAAQHQAIMASKQTRGLVIQGPPGTGKSQTITNLIGQLISEKKSVLFVSEKRAALDVVYSRLKTCGLSGNTSLIHTSDLNKKSFYKSFLKGEKASAGQADWEKASKSLEIAKNSLNQFHDAIESKHYCGLPNSEVLTRAVLAEKENYDLSIDQALGRISFDRLQELQEVLIQVRDLIDRNAFYKTSPWLHKRSDVVDTAHFRQEFTILKNHLDSIKEVDNKALLLQSEEPLNLLKNQFQTALFVSGRYSSWSTFYPRLKELEGIIEKNSALSNDFDSSTTIEDAKSLLEHFSKNHSFFSWFSSHHRRMKKLRNRVHRNMELVNPLSRYRSFVDCKRAEGEIKNTTGGRDLGELEAVYEAFKRFREIVPNAKLIELDGLLEALNILKDINKHFTQPVTNIEILLETFDHIEVIEQIDSVIKDKDLKDYILTKLVSINDDWSEYVRTSYLTIWRDEIKTDFPVLRTTTKERFEDAASKMSDFEKEHRKLASHIISNSCFSSGEEHGLDLIRKETRKKRRVLSPREIMERGALDAMLSIKPCWLMSPLSISQMLPFEAGLFDYVIFDEASQVVVEDSFPAIYRGKSLIVVGDQNQMPPTSFFKTTEDFDDEELEELPESILDLAINVYPQISLKGHYRSKSQELISFSNSAFYDGELRAVPNPTKQSPFKFHQLDNCYFNYKKGNPEEAKAVVNRLEQILNEDPEHSVGILVMGMSQMNAIELAIEERCESDGSFQDLIEVAYQKTKGDEDVGLFVKNLENIQGDERDIILMSVGYAAAAKGKKLRKSFGPLSSSGGSRRLNVAITRAKSRIEVFCSFDPESIEMNDSSTFELNTFLKYLCFVKAISSNERKKAKKIIASFKPTKQSSSKRSTHLASQVISKLTENGLEVEREVGDCGFFLDMAIVKDGSYKLGIECDGASFFSPNYARERDVSRSQLLKSRNWKVYKMGLMDWVNDPEGEIGKIVKELNSTQ